MRTLPTPTNIDELVQQVFGSNTDKRSTTFKQSILYYLNGTANGFLKYCTPPGKHKFYFVIFLKVPTLYYKL